MPRCQRLGQCAKSTSCQPLLLQIQGRQRQIPSQSVEDQRPKGSQLRIAHGQHLKRLRRTQRRRDALAACRAQAVTACNQFTTELVALERVADLNGIFVVEPLWRNQDYRHQAGIVRPQLLREALRSGAAVPPAAAPDLFLRLCRCRQHRPVVISSFSIQGRYSCVLRRAIYLAGSSRARPSTSVHSKFCHHLINISRCNHCLWHRAVTGHWRICRLGLTGEFIRRRWCDVPEWDEVAHFQQYLLATFKFHAPAQLRGIKLQEVTGLAVELLIVLKALHLDSDPWAHLNHSLQLGLRKKLHHCDLDSLALQNVASLGLAEDL
mmetsp:Transcript_70569/g.113757  ORF Transcript_70569/g.113757 Transcript_70569/m.113757 type:complete len:322 (+) Transcript_70569:247-1212(+)